MILTNEQIIKLGRRIIPSELQFKKHKKIPIHNWEGYRNELCLCIGKAFLQSATTHGLQLTAKNISKQTDYIDTKDIRRVLDAMADKKGYNHYFFKISEKYQPTKYVTPYFLIGNTLYLDVHHQITIFRIRTSCQFPKNKQGRRLFNPLQV